MIPKPFVYNNFIVVNQKPCKRTIRFANGSPYFVSLDKHLMVIGFKRFLNYYRFMNFRILFIDEFIDKNNLDKTVKYGDGLTLGKICLADDRSILNKFNFNKFVNNTISHFWQSRFLWTGGEVSIRTNEINHIARSYALGNYLDGCQLTDGSFRT